MLQRTIFTTAWMLLLSVTACQETPKYDRLRFTELGSSPMDYTTIISSESITLPTDIVQVIKADVEYKGDRYLIGSFVGLSPQNENILRIFPMTKKNHFLLIGTEPGRTCIDVKVNGVWEECIEATVE
jgi:hypothetical protein